MLYCTEDKDLQRCLTNVEAEKNPKCRRLQQSISIIPEYVTTVSQQSQCRQENVQHTGFL